MQSRSRQADCEKMAETAFNGEPSCSSMGSHSNNVRKYALCYSNAEVHAAPPETSSVLLRYVKNQLLAISQVPMLLRLFMLYQMVNNSPPISNTPSQLSLDTAGDDHSQGRPCKVNWFTRNTSLISEVTLDGML